MLQDLEGWERKRGEVVKRLKRGKAKELGLGGGEKGGSLKGAWGGRVNRGLEGVEGGRGLGRKGLGISLGG